MTWLLRVAGLIDAGSVESASFCRVHDLRYANAACCIPHTAETVDAIYSCRMIEHLVRDDAWAFLLECHRVLRPGGRLRLAVPALRALACDYLRRGKADNFLGQMQFDTHLPAGLSGKLKWLLFGGHGNHWMYDARSLAALVADAGFIEVEMLVPGQTRIVDPFGLDLRARQTESLYLEAVRP